MTHTSYDSVLFLTAREGQRAPVSSGKIVREVRRKTRILQRAFPNKARFKCFSDPVELDAGIHAFWSRQRMPYWRNKGHRKVRGDERRYR